MATLTQFTAFLTSFLVFYLLLLIPYEGFLIMNIITAVEDSFQNTHFKNLTTTAPK